ncbi:PTB domain-containing engulfment adapter protein 1-like [Lineus longissimus]|uniref:PTB domain-containing engulfment adapter protein 1-like n=1 Tax=Lineus longissimus TaxID=88925 RepID=UPI002B4CCE05
MIRTNSSGSATVRWKDGEKGSTKTSAFNKHGNKQWVHSPEVLTKGSLVYNIKFLGNCEVDQPKGTEVVRDAIRKMKFNQSLKKTEGQKPTKIELTISLDAVTIQDAKTKMTFYQYPLHRISYCADDKADKKVFTFIARENNSEKHSCFVFSCDKCAEEITLTVGQAFDLAYRRFIETSGKESDAKKGLVQLQQKINNLEQENRELKARIKDLEKMKDRNDLEGYLRENQISSSVQLRKISNGTQQPVVTLSPPSGTQYTNGANEPVVGRRLENLVLDDYPNMRQKSSASATLLPPPRNPRSGSVHGAPSSLPLYSPPTKRRTMTATDVFGSTPFVEEGSTDAFGMSSFDPVATMSPDQLIDMQAGFSRGLSIGTEDFSLDMLDPLKM